MRAHEFIVDEGWKSAVGAGAMALGALGAYQGMKQPAPVEQPAQVQQAEKSRPLSFLNLKHSPHETLIYNAAKSAGLEGDELAQFLAQVKHESWDFTRLKEKPKSKNYFTHEYDITSKPAKAKMLGNVKPKTHKYVGDGATYHGRGFIQLTGRYNYREAGRALGLDLENHPELASEPANAAKIAVWYWKTKVQPKVNNFADTSAVTKVINPKLKGLEDRHANFIKYKSIL